MALDINAADATSILLVHDCVTPEVASAITKNRPDGGYKNLRELETLNSELVGIDWDQLEPLLDFKVPDEFANRWLNVIAQNYGTPSPTSSKGKKAVSRGNGSGLCRKNDMRTGKADQSLCLIGQLRKLKLCVCCLGSYIDDSQNKSRFSLVASRK